ncbi:uncharacterized protein N7458_010732 [Penicillium daleae]|uniref:Uncharacterized protein n=1 Tax=Penicillium daleae TaxID=63821 RepID=A0AAD6C250_9EURO|nr:uncharacterized protein N7458_010732 [Penicillium daleae]KAJ5439734.1 hypothetical protein N7458_010732 [Penicillium daleae]
MSSGTGKSSRPLIGSGRDTHSSEQEPRKWEDFIALGARRQQWIDDPCTPCTIQSSQLTMQSLHDRGWYISKRAPEAVYWLDFAELQALGLPCDLVNPIMNFNVHRYAGETWGVEGADWEGFTGPGIIVISNITRTPNSPSPPMSEVTKAIYERTFDIDSLRYVIMKNVMNEQTVRLIKDLLYTPERSVPWPGKSGQRDTWEGNTPPYQALLGTRLAS